jgi:hypothetical protein
MAGEVTFFTVADARFFPGAVLLINSLRLTGNDGEIVLLDSGLTSEQRRRLEPHARVVEAPDEVRETPMLLKSFPHLLDPQGTIAIIDSDMVVTRSLDPIAEQAGAGTVCMFEDIEDQRGRFIPEWQEAFGLRKPLRRGQDYLNAGFICFSTDHHPELLGRYFELCKGIPSGTTMTAGGHYYQPYWGGDQDAINALLMSEVDGDAVVGLPEAEGPSADLLGEVRVEDERALACTLRGHRTYLMHYWGGPKPWQRQAWMRVQRDAFMRLMPRILFEHDVAIRLHPRELPVWARRGAAASAALTGLGAMNAGARRVLDGFPRELRGKLASGVRRIAR